MTMHVQSGRPVELLHTHTNTECKTKHVAPLQTVYDVSGRYLFWLASGIQTQLLTHSLRAEHTVNISVSVSGTAVTATTCELTLTLPRC